MVRAMLGIWVAPALAGLGLADSVYLAGLHWAGQLPPCGGYSGCAQVNTSAYAELFGVPIAALGAVLYGLLVAAALWRVRLSGFRWGQATLLLYGLTLAGALFMAYLTSVELFVLQAVCYWCVALALITLLLLARVTWDVWAFDATAG